MNMTKLINWVIAFVVSCLLTLAMGVNGFAQSPTAPISIDSGPVQQIVQQTENATRPEQTDITAGIEAFDDGRFSDAIALWKTTLTLLSSTQTQQLTRAYLLSNIANAYQRLGQFTEAQRNLAQSLTIIENWPQQNPAYWQVSARVLNTQGQLQWGRGQSQQALATWQQAQQHYQRVNGENAITEPGLILTQINQALALQELGFNARALQQLDQLSQQQTDWNNGLKLAIAQPLAQALRQVGDVSAAQTLLTNLLNSEALPPQTRQQLQLELGHARRTLSHRAIAIGQTDSAQSYASEALNSYTNAAGLPIDQTADQTDQNATNQKINLLQAKLNKLSFLIEIGQLEQAQTFATSINIRNLSAGRASTEGFISFAHSLNCLQSPTTAACVRPAWQDAIAQPITAASGQNSEANALLLSVLGPAAVKQAQALNEPVLEAYAIGELGHAYELTQQWTEAIDLTEKALSLLEGKQLPSARYRWSWQLGRIYNQQAKEQNTQQYTEQAITAYQQAIEDLAAVRQSLLRVNPQVQFSFRDNVEPIYREFVALLLPSGQTTTEPTQQSLKLAVKTLDALQLTELENFLGCNLAQLFSLATTEIDPNAAKIYPIVLPQQLAIIVDIPGQPLSLQTVPISQNQIENSIENLRNSLTTPGKTPEVITAATQLYSWLITPVESLLAANSQVETLVFVPDGPLRNVPMGVLYDGQQYLIEKDYAIVIAPQLDLFAPRATPQQLKILRGGVSLAQTVRGQSFPPIERVQIELDQIPTEFTAARSLLNEAFTQENIKQQLSTETYSAIHWKTHGVFSSDPGETFLVAYQEGITANELSELVQSARQQQAEPLELLVLSACEIAQSDRRAVLGLAGIAIRAGTRSTLSTLWRADDGANTELMDTFYQGLQDGLSKAQALQAGQKALLTQAGYPAPYYWAPYVLVGNWL